MQRICALVGTHFGLEVMSRYCLPKLFCQCILILAPAKAATMYFAWEWPCFVHVPVYDVEGQSKFCRFALKLLNHGCHRSGNGQGKKILHGQGNVREFYSGSGKIGIWKKSQGKLKL